MQAQLTSQADRASATKSICGTYSPLGEAAEARLYQSGAIEFAPGRKHFPRVTLLSAYGFGYALVSRVGLLSACDWQ